MRIPDQVNIIEGVLIQKRLKNAILECATKAARHPLLVNISITKHIFLLSLNITLYVWAIKNSYVGKQQR